MSLKSRLEQIETLLERISNHHQTIIIVMDHGVSEDQITKATVGDSKIYREQNESFDAFKSRVFESSCSGGGVAIVIFDGHERSPVPTDYESHKAEVDRIASQMAPEPEKPGPEKAVENKEPEDPFYDAWYREQLAKKRKFRRRVRTY